MKTSKRHVLYRFYGADASTRPLYVGVTDRANLRFSQHARDKDWFDDVVWVRLEHFDSRAELLEAERTAIREENPVHNVKRYSVPCDLPRVELLQSLGHEFHAERGAVFGETGYIGHFEYVSLQCELDDLHIRSAALMGDLRASVGLSASCSNHLG